jgi:hypothetical protein
MLGATTFLTTWAKKGSMSRPLEIPAMMRFIPSSRSLSALLSRSLEISLSFSSEVSKYVAVEVDVPVNRERSRVVSCSSVSGLGNEG